MKADTTFGLIVGSIVTMVVFTSIIPFTCNTPVTPPDIQKAEESAHIAIEAAEDYKAVALMFRDTANYWKRQALKADSLRLIAVKSGTESRSKIRALSKDEIKRIADSSYTDVHEWSLICGDSLKQTKMELDLCNSGSIAKDSSIVNLERANMALVTATDTLKFALVQKDKVIAIKDRQIQKERNGKRLWMGVAGILGTLLIIK